MRRFLSILRKPPVLVLPIFLAWIALFNRLGEAQHWPDHQFSTGVQFEGRGKAGFVIARVEHLEDDGKKAVVRIVDNGGMCGHNEELQTWDASSRRNLTGTVSDATPRAFMSDDDHLGFFAEADWPILQNRWADLRAEGFREWSKKVPLDGYRLAGFRAGGYSNNGRFFYYGVRDGLPVCEFEPPIVDDERMRMDAVAVEELATAKRIALLPGIVRTPYVPFWLMISPDGTTAVSNSSFWEKSDDDPVRLFLWDLAGARQRIELALDVKLDGLNDSLDIRYSDDSSMVFICLRGAETRWWDTATGRLRGHIANGMHMALMHGGKLLVTQASYENEERDTVRNELIFWDTSTAGELSCLDLGGRDCESAWNWRLKSSPNGPFLGLEFGYDLPPAQRPTPKRFWLWNFLFPRDVARDQSHMLLIDGVERREIAYLPGRTATFSSNGRWLATIDGDGIVRVWELPLRRPWLRIFGYSAIATLACALVFVAVRWSLRRIQT